MADDPTRQHAHKLMEGAEVMTGPLLKADCKAGLLFNHRTG
jgi:hypothetical protein